MEVRSPVVYKLDLPPHLRHHRVIHISHLKPYHGPPPSTVRNPPPPDIIDGVAHHMVEAFLDSRGSGGRRRYLVKWTGYPDDMNSWEPVRQLQLDLSADVFTHHVQSLDSRKGRSTK